MELQGKVAIVTGGASGIGHAICLRLAGEGADIVIADLALEAAVETAGEVSALGRQALAVKANVTSSQRWGPS